MSCIVKYTRKNGITVAYESIAKWDPQKKQSRPIRKYLGRVDPITGEIIPSSGKRGRPAGSKNRSPVKAGDEALGICSTEISSLFDSDLAAELKTLHEQISAMREELELLRKRNASLERALGNISAQISKVLR